MKAYIDYMNTISAPSTASIMGNLSAPSAVPVGKSLGVPGSKLTTFLCAGIVGCLVIVALIIPMFFMAPEPPVSDNGGYAIIDPQPPGSDNGDHTIADPQPPVSENANDAISESELRDVPTIGVVMGGGETSLSLSLTVRVTFLGNGGVPIAQVVTVPVGTSFDEILTQVEAPLQEGFHFTGWSLDATDMVQPDGAVRRDTRLFAHWARVPAPQVEVTLLGNGGTPAIQSVAVPVGTAFDEIFAQANIPVRDGFDFIGWSLHPASKIYPGAVVMEDTILFAHWAHVPVRQVQVTLFGNGGAPAAQIVIVPVGTSLGEIFAQVDIPVRDGFAFVGWSLDATNMVYPGSVATEDIRLFAYWLYVPTPQVEVTLLGNGGVPVAQIVMVPVGTSLDEIFAQADAPVRDGFHFVAWSLHPADKIHPNAVVEEDTRLFAHWMQIPISWVEVTLLGNGGTPVTQGVAAPVGTSFEEIFEQVDTPARDGFAFVGWSLDAANMVYPGSVAAEDITLFAYWMHVPAPQVEVTFLGNGGIPVAQIVLVESGTSFEKIFEQVYIPTQIGFDFAAWSLHPTSKIHPGEVAAEDTRLFAYWSHVPTPWVEVTFLGNGGTPAAQIVLVEIGTPFEEIFEQVDTPARDGFDFVSWSLDTTNMVYPGSVVEENTILFAYWVQIHISWVEVTLSSVGGDPNIQFVTVPVGTSFEEVFAQAETLVRDGFAFAGWSLHPAHNVHPGAIVEEDTRLFAMWRGRDIPGTCAEPEGEGEILDEDEMLDNSANDCEREPDTQWEAEEPKEPEVCAPPREESEDPPACEPIPARPDEAKTEEPEEIEVEVKRASDVPAPPDTVCEKE